MRCLEFIRLDRRAKAKRPQRVPVFNRTFCDVAHEYLLIQEARAERGEISAARPKKLRGVIEGTLDRYAGSTLVHLIGDERWGGGQSMTGMNPKIE
jgi:hypothetical protein